MLQPGMGSGRLRVGGGQVFVFEILHYLLRQLRQHRFSQSFFCCLWGPGVEKQERRRINEQVGAVPAEGHGGLRARASAQPKC